MLYDGAIGAIARAEHGIATGGNGSVEMINRELTRAQDIVMELSLSLDHERGGIIASNLAAIYEYCISLLTKANMEKSAATLPEVKRHLGDLRSAFASAATQVSAGAA